MNNNLSKSAFQNVYSLDAARKVKAMTGKSAAPIRMSTPESPEFRRHANEAMSMANPQQGRMQKALTKIATVLGLKG